MTVDASEYRIPRIGWGARLRAVREDCAHMSDLLPGDWTAHSLRHAFATEAYARTRDLRLVQEWLGHAMVQTTTRYVQIEHDHKAMEQLRLDRLGRTDEGWAA